MKPSCVSRSRHVCALPASVLLAALCLSPAPVHGQSSISLNDLSFAPADNAAPTPPQSVKSLDLSAIDKTVDPCVDFNQ